eukprot:366443-Chlamydomonas_euryale.AAC.11
MKGRAWQSCYKCNNTWPRGLLRLTWIARTGYTGAHSASPQASRHPFAMSLIFGRGDRSHRAAAKAEAIQSLRTPATPPPPPLPMHTRYQDGWSTVNSPLAMPMVPSTELSWSHGAGVEHHHDALSKAS